MLSFLGFRSITVLLPRKYRGGVGIDTPGGDTPDQLFTASSGHEACFLVVTVNYLVELEWSG